MIIGPVLLTCPFPRFRQTYVSIGGVRLLALPISLLNQGSLKSICSRAKSDHVWLILSFETGEILMVEDVNFFPPQSVVVACTNYGSIT